ncbi:MAG: hypothetical protein LBD67_10360, partial [Candidatus Accumulibacter sp.]|nr:hypothetical protein [Accumulibacter sp.]
APMIVRFARAKVGHRQAPLHKKPLLKSLQNGLFFIVKHSFTHPPIYLNLEMERKGIPIIYPAT